MSLSAIAEVIKNNNNFAIAVHVNPDGDCLGSAAALCDTLRLMGKNAQIVSESPVPERLAFIVNPESVKKSVENCDVCIAVDVASKEMMGSVYESTFLSAKTTCCIDHHGTNAGYADCNFIDAASSAAGELVYLLTVGELNLLSDKGAMCLYAAIASDTGSFRYSNTTSRTHYIASKLLEKDFDAPLVMRKLFEVKTLNQLKLKSDVVSNLRFCFDGKVCICTLDKKMLDKYSMNFEDADDLASLPRSIEGVEVGVFVKIKGENEVKVSLRSNACVNVAQIAANLGGGGHIRAAGVTIFANSETAEKKILDELEKVM